MKKTLLAIFAMIAMTSVAEAQVTMRVELNDGNHVDYPVSIVKSTSWIDGHAPATAKAVDLGLPSGLKWANVNVGAISPEDSGDYFAWGETEPKDDYDRTYKWLDDDSSYSKYCTSSDYGTVDNKTILDPEDDAAHVNWGGDWRMPTYEEVRELCSNCIWTLTTLNGVDGYKVTSATNGNSIFLPAAGYRRTSGIKDANYGCYWSSSLYSGSDIRYACGLHFSPSFQGRCFFDYRYRGFSVRAVCP